jgi:protein-disulfide isomerase
LDETNITQTETGTKSNTKWIVLIAGIGCAVLACIILVIALAVAMFFPITSRAVSEVQEKVEAPQPSVEEAITPQYLGEILIPESKTYPFADANKMGKPDAPVKIIVYSDFQCIYCMNYWEDTEPQLIETYVATGKVYYEYRSYGDFLGPASATAAEAAYCAGDQGKFWQYHDILFLNWAGEGSGDFSPARLQGYADALGMDVKAFSDCLENDIYLSQVEQDVINAQADGVSATPSFLINGKLVEGAQPFSLFESEIEAALGEN